MAEKFSLKDHLFNSETVSRLAGEYAGAVAGFDRDRFVAECLAGFADRELMQRLDWIADCLEPHLAPDFPTMATQITAAMPAPLDPTKTDDDFGHFIHAVPGILTVRHGLEHHRDLALDVLHAATQRFSMEYYIRPFINRWPDETLARLRQWIGDENYHVRRLVSEGTRPRLPWAKAIDLDILAPLEFLDHLHADKARFVTRSVANHLNDIAKKHPDVVIDRLHQWRELGQQDEKELNWMTRHALRTLIKDGHSGAMELLGYRANAAVELTGLELGTDVLNIGEKLDISVTLTAMRDEPVILDYAVHFVKSNGETQPKVFKMKDVVLKAGKPQTFGKRHHFKGDATTFTLYPGHHKIAVHVNGRPLGEVGFELV